MMRLEHFGRQVPQQGGCEGRGEAREAFAQSRRQHGAFGRIGGLSPRQGTEKDDQAQAGHEGSLQQEGMIGAAHGVLAAKERGMGRQRGKQA